MRLLAVAFAGLCIAPTVVVAESGEALRARGEQLAKDGRFTEAIDAFKAAERLEPRARHACLIALAYTRRELWPQAEIFLEQCESRATPADPLPEWVPTAKQQLAERLATVNVAPVTIKVEPAGVGVRLAVSSFAPDELFDPRTIHLPPGRHVIIATAEGYNDAQKTVEVSGKAPQEVTITLLPLTAGTPDPGPGVVAPPPPPPTAPAAASKVPWIVIGVGGTIAALGGVIHAGPFRIARKDMVAATANDDRTAYGEAEARFDKHRTRAIVLYGVGAATLATGIILKLTKYKHPQEAPQLAILPGADGGGMVTVSWAR